MAEYTVGFLIETLQNGYDPNETIVVDWFTKGDVEQVLDDEGWDADPAEVFRQVASGIDDGLGYAVSEINGELFGLVESVVMKGEK